jgi:hypothetical protein
MSERNVRVRASITLSHKPNLTFIYNRAFLVFFHEVDTGTILSFLVGSCKILNKRIGGVVSSNVTSRKVKFRYVLRIPDILVWILIRGDPYL